MSVIEVQAAGQFTTVQDLGREGFGPLGVSPSGAADTISLRVGNRLIGNAENAAGLEMTLLGGTFRFPDGARVALTGSDFGAALDGAPVSLWKSVEIRRGQTLRFGATASGARSYLCVQGGIIVKPFLGSAATHVLSGLGGFEGRILRKGDVLEMGMMAGPFRERTVSPSALERLVHRSAPGKILRVTEGPQNSWFSESSKELFYSSTYRVAEESNRMGLRLLGAPVQVSSDREMITAGVSLGAVQVPSSGQPIIVFVEQQTTGGYPVIANIISADLHSVGQLRPRDEIRFQCVELPAAVSLLKEQERLMASDELMV